MIIGSDTMKPFSKLTAVQLWTDPYISKQMLRHHLEFDNNIASRTINTIDNTVDFISKTYMKNKKSVLDLGCGPGLYTDRFDRLGYRVKGIDISKNSIDYANITNSNVMYELNNYVDMKPNGKFDLVTMIYCDFSVLDYKQRNRVLQNVKAMLSDDGHFIFDVHNLHFLRTFNTGEDTTTEEDGFYMTGSCNITIKNSVYQEEEVCLTHIKAAGERTLEFYNWYQCYSVVSITKLLQQNGFDVVEVYSDTMGNKDFNEGDAMCVVSKVN